MKAFGSLSAASFLVLALAAPAALAQTAAPAPAKAPQAGGLEEVVVTAQRRTEKVQDVPVAVTAFTASQLEAAQIKETKDLVRFVPGLTGGLNTGTGGAVSYYMRGLGSTEQIATFDVPVATYLDEIYIARQSVNNVSLFDVERTEVLRGPQGTLFGRNSTGGAISIITRKPGDKIAGFVEGSYGSFDRSVLRGSIDLPVSDTLLTKFSAFRVDDEGYSTSRTTNEKLNGEEATGARAAVRWLPTSKATWDVAVDYIDQSKTSVGVYPQDLQEYKPRTGLRLGDCDNAISDYINRRVGNCSNIVTGGLTSNFQIDTALATVNFITGYRNTNQGFALDFGVVGAGTQNTGAFMLANQLTNSQFTQEVKLLGETGKWNWVAGAFYLNEETKTEQLQVFGLFGGLVDGHWVMKNDTSSFAVYAQGDYALSDATTFTIGGRWTTEEKSIGYQDATRALAGYNGLGLVSTGALTPPTPSAKTRVTSANLTALGVPLEQSTEKFTPRFALSHKFDADKMVFISATNGFKSGGWEARQTDARLIRTFRPETAWSYEAGLRSEWFDRKLRFNATAYMLRVEDVQLISGFPVGTGVSFITQNNGKLNAQGLEIETLVRPAAPLDLFATLSLADREYKDVPNRNGAGNVPCSNTPEPASCITTKDDPVRFPEWQATIGGRYTQSLGENAGTLSFSAAASLSDYYWTSTSNDTGFVTGVPLIAAPGTFGTVPNTVALSKVPHTIVVNVGAKWVSPNEKFEAALDCSNCTEEYYFTSSLVGVGYENDPRRVTARLKYKF